MIVNAVGSGAIAKGNIMWDANGNVAVNGGGTFNGHLAAATGSFNGSVKATSFIAGDESGTNVTVSDDSINFNVGSQKRAWFSPFEYTVTNGEIVKTSNESDKGFYLYIIDGQGQLRTLDFTNSAFTVVGAVQAEVITEKLYSIRPNTSTPSDLRDVIIGYNPVYKVINSGTTKYYSDSNWQSLEA